MQNCLLIGGAGFIGSNLASCFSEHGYHVTIYDLSDGIDRMTSLSNVITYKGDYFRDGVPNEIVEGQDAVILLACSVGPQTSMNNPERCYNQDIASMISLLEQMKKCGANRLVLISSGGTVYGNHKEKFLSEEMETFPINHYGIMKLTQEKILMMYNRLYDMNNVAFRLSNPYGPGQCEASGIGAVTTFLHKIIDEKKISLYGTGKNVRDYIYIDDVSEMIYRYLKINNFDEKYAIYNVGTGKGETLLDIISIIEKVTGKTAQVELKEKREFDVESNILQTKKLKTIIGNYECLDIEEGIRRYLLCESK